MPGGLLRIFDNPEVLAVFAAEEILRHAHRAIQERGRFLLVLSGGSTPKRLLGLMGARPYRDLMLWEQTHIFWADERMVPHDSPESNFGEARRLLFSQGMLDDHQIHPVQVGLSLEQSCEAYQETIRAFAESGDAWPSFDMVLLGMGADGHTASIFPGDITPLERTRAVITVHATLRGRPQNRISMTPMLINRARRIMFMVVGSQKAETLAVVLGADRQPERYPAQRIEPESGRLLWLVDQDAAQGLERGSMPLHMEITDPS